MDKGMLTRFEFGSQADFVFRMRKNKSCFQSKQILVISVTRILVLFVSCGMCVPLSRLVANLQSRQCCDRACFGFPQDLVQVTTTSFRPSDGKSCQNGCTKTNIRPILHAERRNVKDAGNQNITKHRDTMMCLISLIKNPSSRVEPQQSGGTLVVG